MGKEKKHVPVLKYVCFASSILAALGFSCPLLVYFSTASDMTKMAPYIIGLAAFLAVCIVLAILTLYFGPTRRRLSFWLLIILTAIVLLCVTLPFVHFTALFAALDVKHIWFPLSPLVTVTVWIVLFWFMRFKYYR